MPGTMLKILKSIKNSLLILILFTSTALAGGAKISELKKEAKSDDDGKFYLRELHKLNAPHGLNSVSLSDKSIVGNKSFRFEVNNGECGQNTTSDCETERERSELYYLWKNKDDHEKWKKEKWYRFYVFVPKEYNSLAPSKTSIIQWKRINPSKVLIMFQLFHGGLYFNINGDTFKDVQYHLKYFKDLRGQWTEILFNTNWHPDADKGYMKVWIDGEMKIDYKGVANHSSKGKDLNLRYGIYSSFLDRYRNTFGETKHKQRVLYFDGVRGDTTCEKLLKDQKRCNDLLSQNVKLYKLYSPKNTKTVKKFDERDLKILGQTHTVINPRFTREEVNFLMNAKDNDEKCIREQYGSGLDLIRKDSLGHERYYRCEVYSVIKQIVKDCTS